MSPFHPSTISSIRPPGPHAAPPAPRAAQCPPLFIRGLARALIALIAVGLWIAGSPYSTASGPRVGVELGPKENPPLARTGEGDSFAGAGDPGQPQTAPQIVSLLTVMMKTD